MWLTILFWICTVYFFIRAIFKERCVNYWENKAREHAERLRLLAERESRPAYFSRHMLPDSGHGFESYPYN